MVKRKKSSLVQSDGAAQEASSSGQPVESRRVKKARWSPEEKAARAVKASAVSEVDSEEAAEAEAPALEQLRALLAPSKDLPEAPTPLEELNGPDAVDWTKRCYVVDSAQASTPVEKVPMRLHPNMAQALKKTGFTSLFPVQTAVIPLLVRAAECSWDSDSCYSCDVCITAPTGQGKTLVYALPILQALLDRLIRQPRALILLPTRDLALQVWRVFESLRQALGGDVAQLRALCLTGEKSFLHERAAFEKSPPDVVICTPGRLADHYFGQDRQLNFGALRWFVADEADRLLHHSFNRWLDVLDRCSRDSANSVGGTIAKCRMQKLLLSATMTWNPQKLAMLRLHRPLYFFASRSGKYTTPSQLRQYTLKCKPNAKPLAVLHLLRCVAEGKLDTATGGSSRVVIFCSSVDSCHRLARLLQIFAILPQLEPFLEQASSDSEASARLPDVPAAHLQVGAVVEFSSALSQKERNAALRSFRDGKVCGLVCSDVAARGIDIPEVQAVINYTAPKHLQTYIHRVGRTARAGRSGHTFTFVPHHEMSRFEKMLKESADCLERLQKFPLPKEVRNPQQQWYSRALRLLELCIDMESQGSLSPSRPLVRSDFESKKAPEAQSKASAAERRPPQPDPTTPSSTLLDFLRST